MCKDSAIFVSSLLFFFIFCFPIALRAQDRCGTVAYGKTIKSQGFDQDIQFENWIDEKLKSRSANRTKAGPYKIPVVVHVIHNGEPVGTGTNISDAQILSQIKVLNDDFRRQNADASSTDPAFVPVASGMDIQFVLAKRNPEGLATTGIVRVKGSKEEWTSNDNYQLKSQSYWPSENYLNIWVCNITDFLGYAQFPISDLPGLGGSSSNAATDGLVISFNACGSIDDGNFDLDPDYNKGRTATHEIGHYLGLRHIWGDVTGCGGTDYVEDTPNQAGPTQYCPQQSVSDACSDSKMFQNFLDYTDDACMNLFTRGQVERMIVVLENSPRRASLLTSTGLLPPEPVPNDLGIREIFSPTESECIADITPTAEIKNYGNNNVTSARISLRINGTIVETKDFTLSLQPLDFTTIDFSLHTLNKGMNTVAIELVLTNGVADGDPASNNNILTRSVLVPENVNLPFRETFNTLPQSWNIQNPDQQATWQLANAPNFNTDNKALSIPFYTYEDNLGEIDILRSPVFDLSASTSARLFFDVAYMAYNTSVDGLRVVVLTNCSSLSEGTVVYEKTGLSLATTSRSKPFFIPNGANDWRRETIDLSAFVGQDYVQLAFVGINDYGNNLYLDNISVVTQDVVDLSLDAVVQPSVVTGNSRSDVVVRVQNTGSQYIGSLQLDFTLNEAATTPYSFTVNLPQGADAQLTIPGITLRDGENNMRIAVSAVNGDTDAFTSNNTVVTKVVVNHAQDKLPLRQNFDAPYRDVWTITNVNDGMIWQPIETNYNQSLYFRSFQNTNIGDQTWLVSPALDFSSLAAASMIFDLAYVTVNSRTDDLRILASTDNGNTYRELNFAFPEPGISTGSWAPQGETDWFDNLYVDLSDLAGETSVRIAFVNTTTNSNNLYIDNIEFFITDAPPNVAIERPYNIYGYTLENIAHSELKIGFNLNERNDVKCEVIDIMGKQIATVVWQDVLNQIYELPPYKGVSAGIYIVRLHIGNQVFAERIFLSDSR